MAGKRLRSLPGGVRYRAEQYAEILAARVLGDCAAGQAVNVALKSAPGR